MACESRRDLSGLEGVGGRATYPSRRRRTLGAGVVAGLVVANLEGEVAVWHRAHSVQIGIGVVRAWCRYCGSELQEQGCEGDSRSMHVFCRVLNMVKWFYSCLEPGTEWN